MKKRKFNSTWMLAAALIFVTIAAISPSCRRFGLGGHEGLHMRVECMSLLRSLGTMANFYHEDHDQWPVDWGGMEVYGASPEVFICPASGTEPAARITARNHPAADEVNKAMVDRGLDMLRAMKPRAKKVYPLTWHGITFHLQQGTCRFGVDPSSSVLSPSCQAHEVKNLYVTDASFMPTSGGVPSTATIMANSLRVAHLIRRRFLRREIP